MPVASPDRAPAARIARAAGDGPQVGGGARASRVPGPSSWVGASRDLAPGSGSRRSRQLAILRGSVWASARMSRAAGCDRREPRVAYSLRRLPGVDLGQVARPGPGGVARVGGALTREVRHERAVSAVDLARPAAVGAIRQSALDAALEVPRRARAHAVGRAPDPPGVSPESHGSRIRALAATWVVRMRAIRSDPSLPLAPSAIAVLDPAKSCLPSPLSVNGGMPYLQSSYFVDIVLVDIERPLDVIVAGREIGREPCCGEPPLGPSACLSGLALLGNAFDGSVLPPAHVSSLYRHKFRPGDLN